MIIRPLDLSDDRALTDAFEVERAATLKARPEWVGRGLEARVLGWRAKDGWTKRLLGAWDGAVLQGFAACMTSSHELSTTWIFIWVHPNYQGHGSGSALVRAAEGDCPPTTTRFVTSAYRQTLDGIAALETRFLNPLGYTVATTETVVELNLLSAHLPEIPAVKGYNVATYINGVPLRFREQVGQIKGLVDAEAPNGDLGWSETAVTPAEYVSEIDLWISQGSTAVESIAVDALGNVAAWTCLVSSATNDRPAEIEGTLVLQEHRGNGLGAAVKLASLHEAKKLETISRVRTSSDDQNIWMRSINDNLGFMPVESEAIFHKSR